MTYEFGRTRAGGGFLQLRPWRTGNLLRKILGKISVHSRKKQTNLRYQFRGERSCKCHANVLKGYFSNERNFRLLKSRPKRVARIDSKGQGRGCVWTGGVKIYIYKGPQFQLQSTVYRTNSQQLWWLGFHFVACLSVCDEKLINPAFHSCIPLCEQCIHGKHEHSLPFRSCTSSAWLIDLSPPCAFPTPNHARTRNAFYRLVPLAHKLDFMGYVPQPAKKGVERHV